MSDNENVCRLCLQIVSGCNFSSLDETSLEKFKLILPDLKLIPSVNPIVCNICKESLEESHKLKRTCTSSNKLIKFLKNYLGIKHNVELKELIRGNHKKDEKWPRNGHVCRICLKSNEGDYKSIKDAKTDEFGPILESCLSSLDENLTSNPLICKICIETLYKTCTFINQFTNVENKVKSYCEKFPTESVNLLEVLNYEKEEEKKFSLQLKDKDDQEVSNAKMEEEKHHSPEDYDRESAEKMNIDHESNDEEDSKSESSPVEPSADSETAPNELPHFNFNLCTIFAPYKRKIHIEDWMKQVEEVKSRLKWSDFTTKYKIIGMMKRLPQLHAWFSSVANVMSWEEFKEKLVYSFPDQDDFYINIMRMVKRKKRPTETFVEYFEGKLPLLEPLNLSEEQIVSCLLGGVSSILTNCIGRFGRYKTRDELLNYFKSCDEKDKINSSMMHKKGKNVTDKEVKVKIQNKVDQKSLVTSENASVDSLFNGSQKNLIVLLENKKLEVNMALNASKESSSEKQNEKNSEASDQICSCCDQKGHSGMNCPLIKTNKIPRIVEPRRIEKVNTDRGSQNNNIIVVHENIVISPGSSEKTKEVSEKIEISAPQDTNIIPKESKVESSSEPLNEPNTSPKSTQKCACCDKSGHTSMDCPLIKGKVEVRHTQRQGKHATSSDRGRQIENIITVRENELEFENKDASQKKCTFCDKTGHSTLVCPLIDCEGNTPRRNNIRIVLDKDRLNKTKLPSGSFQDDFVCEVVQDDQKVVNQKCSCCDKIGHTSLNCPLLGPNKQSGRKQSPVNQIKCSNCNKVGHSSLNCLLTKVNIRDKVTDKSQSLQKKVVYTVEKCSNCGKLQHLSTDCPYIAVNRIFETSKNNEELPEESIRKCLCCNQVGHSSLDCPLLGINKQDLPKQSRDKTFKSQPINTSKPSHSQNTTHSEEKCSCCNKSGHMTQNCPFYSFFNRNNPGATGNNANSFGKSKTQENPQRLNVSLPSSSYQYRPQLEDKDQPPHKRAKDSSLDEKCYFCNKSGHSSVDCFRAKFEQKHVQSMYPVALPSREKEKQQQNVQHPEKLSSHKNVLTCEFCNRVGHKLSDCFFARFDRKIYESQSSTSSSVSRQCLYCGKFGHLQPDCPKNKPPSRRSTGFRPSQPGSSRY